MPEFADDGHVVFIDGSCALCSWSARVLAKADHAAIFKIATVQSALGRAVLAHYGMDPYDPASWLYLRRGEVLKGSDAIIAVAAHLRGTPALLRCLKFIPAPLREVGYRFVARHRYRLMGRTDVCALPDKALKERML